jgi:hypothetical protein
MQKKSPDATDLLDTPLRPRQDLWEQQISKLPLLFKKYGIDTAQPGATLALTLALAAKCERGFRTENRGAPRKTSKLNDNIARYILARTAKGVTVSAAAKRFASRGEIRDEKGKLLNASAIKRRAELSFLAPMFELAPRGTREVPRIPAEIGALISSRLLHPIVEATIGKEIFSVIALTSQTRFASALSTAFFDSQIITIDMSAAEASSVVAPGHVLLLLPSDLSYRRISLVSKLSQVGLTVDPRCEPPEQVADYPLPAIVTSDASVPSSVLAKINDAIDNELAALKKAFQGSRDR